MPKIYVDLDGVLTDFQKQLSALLDKPLDRGFEFGNDPKIWKKIDNAGEDFWSDMEWMPDGSILWDELKEHNPTILTAPSRHKSSRVGKEIWLENNMPGVPFIIEEKKYKYASPGSVLIDDRKKNIDAWEKAGGIGILHKNTSKTINILSKVLSKMNNKKKACLSFFLRQAAGAMFELGPNFTSTAPRGLNKKVIDKKNKPLLWGIESYKKKLMYNVLDSLAKKLSTEGAGGTNRLPMSNVNKLILKIKDSENLGTDTEQIKKDIRDDAIKIFPPGHPKSDLNWAVAEFVMKAINNADADDLKSLANKINPREQMRGEPSQSPFKVKWAADKIVSITKKIMLRYAAIKKIKTKDGRIITIDKLRLQESCKPPKVITPKKGGPYKRDKGVSYDQ